jgi:hypothetical protein
MAFKATDFLITPSDIPRAVRWLFGMSWGGWLRLALFVGAVFAIRHFGMDVDDALFALFFVAVFLWDIDGRIPVSGALIFIVLIILIKLLGPYTQILNETTWPEAIAVWVFYLLSIGVLKFVWDHMRGKDEAGALEVEPSERPELLGFAVSSVLSVSDAPVHVRVQVTEERQEKEGGEIRRTPQGNFCVEKRGNWVIIKPL